MRGRRRVLDRYVGREIGGAFAAGLGLFVVVVTFVQLLKLLDHGQAVGLGGAELAWAVVYALPPTLGLLLPISWLYACLLGIGRLTQDREVLALMQAGVAPDVLFRVPLRVGCVLAAVSVALLGWGEPWGVRGLSALLAGSAQRALSTGLQPRTFYGVGGALTVYADAAADGELRGLLLADRRRGDRPATLFADRARVACGPAAGEVTFYLRDGTLVFGDPNVADGPDHIDVVGWRRGPTFVDFASGRYRLRADALFRAGRRSFTDDQGLSLRELWARAYGGPGGELSRITLQRKLALPLAAPIFGALAVPLGLGARGAARARSLLASGGIVGVYYYVGRSLELAARRGALPATLAAWLPDVVGLLALGALWAWRRRRPG